MVPSLETWKLESWVGGNQIVATRFSKGEESVSHLHTNHMETIITRASMAFTVTIIACDWIATTV
jgi:hypothetical protein